MKKTEWSEYDKYTVMADKSNRVKLGYQHFLTFKIVMEKIRSMLKQPQGGSFNLTGDTYIKTPAHDEVMKCLDAVDDCRYNDLITHVAHRMNMSYMLSAS